MVEIQGKLHHLFRRHQGGCVVMVWDGIINDEIVGLTMIRNVVKINSSNYCDFLNDVLVSWFDEQN